MLGVYGAAACADTLTCNSPGCVLDHTITYTSVTVNASGTASGTGSQIVGSGASELTVVNAGGSLTLDGATVSNDVSAPTGMNGRAIRATGAGATADITNSTIDLTANSDNNYNHAYTAAVGADDGGHVVLDGGSITATGSKRTVGIDADGGGSVIDASNLTIDTYSTFGHAVNAYTDPGLAPTTATVNLDKVRITTHDPVYADGIQSANLGASVNATDTDITTSGSSSFGAEVFNGATATLTNGSIATSGAGAAGLLAYGGAAGPGSITATGTQISTSGSGASGVLAGDSSPSAGIVTLQGVGITTSGDNSAALESAYGSSVSATDSTLLTQGLYGYGAYAHDGGGITLSGGTVTTANATGEGAQDGDGSRAYALYADGAGSSIAAGHGTTIVTDGQRAYGAYATNGAQVALDGASITTHGFMAYGLYSSGVGSQVSASNVNITTTGDAGDAVWAYAGGTTNVNGGNISVQGSPNINPPYETANGFVALGGDGVTAPGTINASNVTVVTYGPNSMGAEVGAPIGEGGPLTSGVLNLSNSSITVQGSGAVAANVSYGSTFAASGSTLTSQQGDGIVMTGNANVALNDTTVQAAGAALHSILDSSGVVQNISIGSGSVLTQNDGTLLQVSRNAAGMDGIVNLTLRAGSTAVGNIDDIDGLAAGGSGVRSEGGKTNFTVEPGASWTGMVVGVNDTQVQDGGSFTDNGGAPIAGNVAGGEGATLTFNNGAQIGGGVGAGAGTQGTFNGTTSIGGSVQGSGSVLDFNGPTDIGQSVAGTSGASFVFSGPAHIGQNLSGDGASFEFSKGDSTVIGGSVNLAGNSSLKGGSIDTPILIQGSVTAGSGSTLGGNLFVDGSLGGSGATLSPGNSVGTQSYAISAGFSGAYKAEVNAAGKSDLVIIRSGNLDLSGIALSVAQENGNGGYVLDHPYTIIQTPGGAVQNTFQSAALDSSFAGTLVKLDPVLYGTQDVRVMLSVDDAKVAGVRSGLSANQNATLDGALSVAGRNTAADAALASADTRGALDQLSGEVHASTQSALLSAGDLLVRTLAGRMRANLGASMAAGAPVAAAGALPAGAAPGSSALPLWAQVVGDWQSFKGQGDGAASSQLSLGGLYLGGDTQVGGGWRIGAALGYAGGRVNVDDRNSRADLQSYTASVYGGKSWRAGSGRVNFLAGAAYTRDAIDSRRQVTTGGSQALTASYHADAAQLFTELGYALPVGRSADIEPYARLAWINQHTQGFDESGGAAALHGDSSTDSLATLTLGLRGATEFDLGARAARVTAGLGWRHAGGDVNPKLELAFIQGSGASYSVSGAPIARDAAVLDVGAEMAVGKRAAAGLSYNGQYGAGNTDNAGTVYLKLRF